MYSMNLRIALWCVLILSTAASHAGDTWKGREIMPKSVELLLQVGGRAPAPPTSRPDVLADRGVVGTRAGRKRGLGVVLFLQSAGAQSLVQEIEFVHQRLLFVPQSLLFVGVLGCRQSIAHGIEPVIESLFDASRIRLRNVQKTLILFVDGNRRGYLSHRFVRGRQPVYVKVVYNLLLTLHWRGIKGVVQDGQREFGQFITPLRTDPHVNAAIVANKVALALLGDAFRAADMKPAATRLQAF